MNNPRPDGRRGREDPTLRGGTAAMLVRAVEVPRETARPPMPRRSRRYFGISHLAIRLSYFTFLVESTVVLHNGGKGEKKTRYFDKFSEISFIAI